MARKTSKLAFLIFLTFVSLGESESLKCSYETDSRDWSMTAFCTVVTEYKIAWCEWRAKNTTDNLISGNLISTKYLSTKNYLWNCSAKIELPSPSPNGLYTCEVLLEEERNSNRWQNAFSIRITDPGPPVLKNCPAHVTDGESVTCKCSSERDGKPRPVFSWPGQTNSSILRLYQVRKNMTHTCEMSWGKARKTVSYTLTVSSSIVTPRNRGGRRGKGDDNQRGSGSGGGRGGGGRGGGGGSVVVGGGDGGEDDDDGDGDVKEVIVPIMGVVAVFIIIAVTAFIVIVIIRRKKTVSNSMPSNSRQTEVEFIENSYYGGFQFDRGTEFKMAGNGDAEVKETARNERETEQTDLYAAVYTIKERQTVEADVYPVF